MRMYRKRLQEARELVCGGRYDKLVYYPTIVTDVKPNMRIFTDQTFGPVASITVVNDAEEALAVANNSSMDFPQAFSPKTSTAHWTWPCVSKPAWSTSVTKPSTMNPRLVRWS